jgi:two-component system chemotaxis sensor kinase CheA
MDDMSPIIGEFLTESYENLDQLDQDLVDLEANPEEKSLLVSIFRTIHTIKGTCGFLGFTKLESIAHVGENLLSKLRDGELAMTQDIANSLLTMVDAIRVIMSNIEADHSEGGIDYSDLVALMTYLQSDGNPEPSSSAEAAASDTLSELNVSEPLIEEASEILLSTREETTSKAPLESAGSSPSIEEAVQASGKDDMGKRNFLEFFFMIMEIYVGTKRLSEI